MIAPMLQAAGVSPRFLALLDKEPLAELCALDVGTGWGRLALALAPACRRVVGLERDPVLVDEARRRARRAGLDNVEFVVADAESVEYAAFEPDLVTGHLCMSDAIAERAARVLRPGQVFAFVAFHADQWRETGRRSRFAYDEGRMAALLERLGFAVEHLQVEQEVQTFPSTEAALAAVAGLEDRWRSDGRWLGYLRFLEAGGRTLTRSHLLVKARRR
jgi:ubiquinone/menaquinone biosynthesis C-methylase UbiE